MRLRPVLAIVLLLTLLIGATSALAQPTVPPAAPPKTLRFAQFNASLNRAIAGQLVSDLSTPYDTPDPAVRARVQQARNVAEIIQRINPDVVLINEFDYVEGGDLSGNEATRLFQSNFLSVSQNGAAPISFPYVFVAPSNTGIASGFDLNNNGVIVTTPGAPGYGDDALGFGNFPGQFGMVIYSKYPIEYAQARTFQTFLWKDMPGARLPVNPATSPPTPWYSPEELAIFRLSSKSHWDVPIRFGGEVIHALTSHPTPPVFDGPEDRNGTRNADEIRFWNDYITPGQGGYIYDDQGRTGGLASGAKFVIMGDQNADPNDGSGILSAIRDLLASPLINIERAPESPGGPQQAALQGGANAGHLSDPRFDTADFADTTPGNLRADYVLPSAELEIVDARVFWPLNSDPLFRLVGTFTPSLPGGFPSSDHRAIWVDLIDPDRIAAVSPSRETRDVIDDEDLAESLGKRLGDADDPAIWVSPFNPTRSRVITVLKDGGLDVYDLNGRLVQQIDSEPGKERLRYNNVDLSYNVTLSSKPGAEPFDLVAVTDRRNDLMVFFMVDKNSGRVENITAPDLPRVFTEGDDEALDDQTTAYGIALYRASATEVYAFVSKRSSNKVAQLRLSCDESNQVRWELVRTITFPLVDDDEEESQVEGMVVDQERGIVYMGQEQRGIWRAAAAPGGATDCPSAGCTLIDAVYPEGPNLEADVEGLTIYYAAGGQGYLLVSSQGDNTFAVYDRKTNVYLGSFQIGARGLLDSVEESDGADVVNVPLGRSFPKGLLVVQDGDNDPAVLLEDDGELENVNSNFKFIRWDSVANAFPTPLIVDTTGFNPREPGRIAE